MVRRTLPLVVALGCMAPKDSVQSDPVSQPTSQGETMCVSGEGIQRALDDAVSGQTVEICSGLHAVSLEIGTDLTLLGVETATLTGDSVATVIRIVDGATVTLRGLTIRDGSGLGEDAGGIEAGLGGPLTIEACDLLDNDGEVGGLRGPEGALTLLSDTQIVGNNGVAGGGAVLYEASLERVTVRDNIASSAGGGLKQAGGAIVAADTLFEGNEAVSVGGGLYMVCEGCTWEGGVFQHNHAFWGGGIMATNSEVAVTIADAVLESNTAGEGGGVTVQGDSDLVGLTVADNVASERGGGIFLTSAYASTLIDCDLSGNTAPKGGGLGGVSMTAEVQGGAWHRNSATEGGAVRVESGSVLHAADVDFGAGADDNTPADITTDVGDWSVDGVSSVSCIGWTGCE